jgi:type IV pilus assembly protein PilE
MKSNNRASPTLSGFTLIELMVAVVIVGVLAMIAIPNYAEYVKRSRIIDGTSRLSDFRVRMEQYFLDNRKYSADGGGCGISMPPTGAEAFSVACALGAGNTYTVTATGLATKGMQEFGYSIDQSNGKKTLALPAAWNQANKDSCWITRKDGSCG